MISNKKIFPFVVAGKWPDGSLCPYSLGSEVRHGTMEDAKKYLDYVNSFENKLFDEYKIYKLIELKEGENINE